MSAIERSGGISPDKAVDILVVLFTAHKEAARDATSYRHQAAAFVATAFAPFAASLVALLATGHNKVLRVEWVLSLALGFFVVIVGASAWWISDMGKRHLRHREAMQEIVDVFEQCAWLAQSLPKQPARGPIELSANTTETGAEQDNRSSRLQSGAADQRADAAIRACLKKSRDAFQSSAGRLWILFVVIAIIATGAGVAAIVCIGHSLGHGG